MVEETKKCLRQGCRIEYLETENNDLKCKFHPGQAIFHDLKKGWSCCNQVAYEWPEFEKLVGCSTGRHTNNKEDAGD